ncbi:hypothetical protein SISNIDRAFT_464247 [Sistotremastrum niveocremeum HHB9708]|uniref:Uncharacterized protein n=1 Tax=Sistotremastrum niveocremeum HHB9708 TaxID=1314777 RepID=A0A164XHB4_9AGAM|nr:hypothetical protein SISNIDRAFT_464247 [Sistotremastrum niveocremeum HHB9708]
MLLPLDPALSSHDLEYALAFVEADDFESFAFVAKSSTVPGDSTYWDAASWAILRKLEVSHPVDGAARSHVDFRKYLLERMEEKTATLHLQPDVLAEAQLVIECLDVGPNAIKLLPDSLLPAVLRTAPATWPTLFPPLIKSLVASLSSFSNPDEQNIILNAIEDLCTRPADVPDGEPATLLESPTFVCDTIIAFQEVNDPIVLSRFWHVIWGKDENATVVGLERLILPVMKTLASRNALLGPVLEKYWRTAILDYVDDFPERPLQHEQDADEYANWARSLDLVEELLNVVSPQTAEDVLGAAYDEMTARIAELRE